MSRWLFGVRSSRPLARVFAGSGVHRFSSALLEAAWSIPLSVTLSSIPLSLLRGICEQRVTSALVEAGSRVRFLLCASRVCFFKCLRGWVSSACEDLLSSPLLAPPSSSLSQEFTVDWYGAVQPCLCLTAFRNSLESRCKQDGRNLCVCDVSTAFGLGVLRELDFFKCLRGWVSSACQDLVSSPLLAPARSPHRIHCRKTLQWVGIGW